MTKRYRDALNAFDGDKFHNVLRMLIRVRKADNDLEEDEGLVVVTPEVLDEMCDADIAESLTDMVLSALDDATLDAVMVVMYAGRDGDYALPESGRYDEIRIEDEFAEWWDYLTMDGELHVLAILREKRPLDRYLASGMHMFRIDER